MPTYEYACRSCGEHLEVVQSFKDEPLTECPACGGPLRKVFGAIGIAFKGSGFYKNDSRASSGSKSKVGSGEKKADTKADSTGGSSSDTKSDSAANKSDASGTPASPKSDTKSKPSGPRAAASS